MLIIDAHCHAGRGDVLNAPWNTDAPLDKYFRRARAAGITRTIVVPTGHSDYIIANTQLARIVASQPQRLIGFASLHATRDAGRVFEMVKQAVTKWGFWGLKVHGYDALPTREACEAVQSFRIPMLLDVVGRAYVIDLLAPQFRDVDFIIPHLGSFMDDWRAQQQVVDQLVRHPNVYADTAGVRRFDYLVQAVKRAGAHKLIFGSDGPWLHPGVELAKIRALGLSAAEEQLVLSGNILRLIARVRRQPEAGPTIASSSHEREGGRVRHRVMG